MRRAMVVMLLGVGGFLAVLGTVKYKQIQAGQAMAATFRPPPQAVTTIRAVKEPWPVTISAIGTVVAVQGVTLSADLPGVVTSIAFESGHSVRQGQVLVRLDTRLERAQLAAAESQRNLARLNLDRVKTLHSNGVVPPAEFERATAEDAQAEARVGEIRAAIGRKEIRAPFSGVLGIRQVNLGQYLNGGEAIVSLQALDPVYVNFSVPQQQMPHVGVGGQVKIDVEGLGSALDGRITAVDPMVDPSTRSTRIQATLANPNGRLRPGMFVNTRVLVGSQIDAVTVPASAIQYAPYGNSIFVVADLSGPNGQKYRGVRQQIVKLGASRGDQVSVISGLEEGAEVVTSGTFKLRNDAAVLVNNELKPANSPAPNPENN